MRMRSILGASFVGAALTLGTMAAPAQASIPSWCSGGSEWSDTRTYGASCDVDFAYYARVTCTNGTTTKTARGVTTNDGRYSYAYCTAFGSSYRVKGAGTPVKA
ncbi:hypothetical protein Ade02nite_88290 [Paractinoplanes deccanensis]|uniref:Uncharacterized protein n=1 Tax=Paractinoplanes deccanensis TaxID=113561 RepID=A0ABQ3YJL4_9ACTN|nr:hypothetical protein [Actinoplanes deccanensis]GID80188.1 hypothetical protein Ade02nite_88290 [Actinoplanes deccanensis]